MNSYQQKSISITPETYIEIHCNTNVSNRPYLIKIFAYEGYTEHRLDQKEMLNLSESIADFVFDNSNTTGYNDELTGLARLWHHRRNEAVKELEKYTND
jgi:hypothetical protein